MTLKELLKHGDASDWEKLSDEELQTLIEPYFNVTRPSAEKLKQAQARTTEQKKPSRKAAKSALQDALELARRHGINVTGLKK